MTETKGTSLNWMLGAFTLLATPIRTFHLTIGHSFVSGMALLGLSLIACVSMSCAAYIYVLGGWYEEDRLQIELNNIKVATELGIEIPQPDPGGVAYTAGSPGVIIQISKLPDAIAIRVNWRNQGQTNGGIYDIDISSDVVGSIVTGLLPKAELGTTWATDSWVYLDVYQVLSTGRVVKLSKRNARFKVLATWL